MPIRLTLAPLGMLVLALVSAAPGQEAAQAAGPVTDFKTAWQEDFSGPKVAGATVICLDGGDPANATLQEDPEALILSFKEGVLTLGGRFEKGGVANRGFLAWGQGGIARFPSGKGGAWNHDIKEYPIIEIRARKTEDLGTNTVNLWAVMKRKDGALMTARFWPSVADDWRVSTFRLAPDSSVPQDMTSRVLVGMNIDFYGSRPMGLEIDWIRLRGFNEEEKVAEEERIKRLTRYRVPRYRLLEEMFAFGVWNAQDMVNYPLGVTQMSCGGFEGNYGLMVRNHLNVVPSTHTAGYYRYRGHWRSYGPKMEQMPAVEKFIEAMRPRLKAAAATGLRLGAHVNGFGVDLEKHGPAFVEPAIRKIVEALGDSPALLGYSIDDEPSAGAEWQIAGVKQIFEENDPKHPTFFPINAGLHHYRLWEPYVALHLPDDYRIHFGRRNPWHVGEMSRAASQFSKRPPWMIIQSFGAVGEELPEGAQGTYACPTPAELRLMTYLSVANGAKGIIYYNWGTPLWKWAAFPVDAYGNPEAEGILDEISRLGERLVPIGHLLLSARWVDSSGSFEVKANQSSERGLTIGVLEDESRGVRYLGVVNNDVEKELDGMVKVLSKAEEIYDLYGLKQVAEKGASEFPVAKLAAGEGRFYVQASAQEFEKVRSELLIAQAKETLHVMTPDFSIARRWKLEMEGIRKLKAAAEAKIAAGQGEPARSLARKAAWGLKHLVSRDETFSKSRSYLNACRKMMGDMYVHMPWREEPWHDEPWKRNPAIVKLVKPYWAVRSRYNELESRFIAGESAGLLDSVQKFHEHAKNLRQDVLDVL